MTKQIANLVPVQSKNPGDHPDPEENNPESTFRKLCGHPDSGVPKEISDVAIPSNN